MELLHVLGLSGLAIGAGVSLVVQQVLNADLRQSLGSPLWAALVSYLVGALTLTAVLIALREPWLSPTGANKASFLSWTGGIFGTVYIVLSILLLPRLGAATAVALMIAGQMLGAMAFDHFGLFGLPEQKADLTRLVGALMLIGGVVLVRS
jgi:bacterial/archaeal transporter family-2 protein